jgi:hypothetical protein
MGKRRLKGEEIYMHGKKKIEGRGNVYAWEFGAVVETKGPPGPTETFEKNLFTGSFLHF